MAGDRPGTKTAANMRRGSPVVLCFIAPNSVFYVKGRGRGLEHRTGTNVEAFEVSVESVESDVHPGLPVTGGIGFRCEGVSEDVLLRQWADRLDVLRSIPIELE